MKAVVLIPFYNYKDFIDEMIVSIKNNETDLDIYICDDCSEKLHYDYIVKKYSKDKSIVIMKNEENLGWNKTMHSLICETKDKYDVFFFCDADDMWDPKKAKLQLDKINEGYNFVSHELQRFKHPNVKDKINSPMNKKWKNNHLINSYSGATWAINKDIANFISELKIKRSTRRLTTFLDLYIALMLYKNKLLNHYRIKEYLLYVRIHDNNTSHVNNSKYIYDRIILLKQKKKEYSSWGKRVSLNLLLKHTFSSLIMRWIMWFTIIFKFPLIFFWILKKLKIK